MSAATVPKEVLESVRNRTNIRRVPFPELTDLPEGLQKTATAIKNTGLTDHAYGHLLRDLAVNHWGSLYAANTDDFVAELNKDNTIVRKRKTIYAGELSSQRVNIGTTRGAVGVFNPDRIPMSVYQKMRNHGQVGLCLAVIKEPLKHVNFNVNSESEEIKELVRWNLSKIYTDLMRDMLLSIDYGSSVLEKVYIKIPNLKLTVPNPEGESNTVFEGEALALKPYAIDPSSYEVLINKFGEMVGIKQRQDFKEVKVKRKKLIVKVNQMEYGNWFGKSRLKSAYTWWYWSEVIVQFMIRYLERKASPAMVIKAPPGKTPNQDGALEHNFDIAKNFGLGLMSNAVGVLPNEYTKDGKSKWQAEYLMDDQRVFMFIEVLSFLNKMIARSLWVPDNVGAQEDGGSFSVTDSRTDVHLIIEEALLKELEKVINKDVVPYIIKYNIPPERRAACTVTIEKLTITRKLMLKELLMKMLGTVNQFARDGGLFNVLPDMRQILQLLEIPYGRIEDIIDLDKFKPTGSGTEGDDDVTAKEKERENNKGKERSPRSRQEKRPKTAA